MSDFVTGFYTKDGVKKYDYYSLANLPESGTDITNTVISPNADYAEVGEWSDGNPDGENRLGYFVSIAEVGDNTIKIRKATSEDDVRGVSVYNPAFSGNASKNKYGADGELLPQYNYIGVMGIVSVIDNGRCSVGGRCMPADDGTAKRSDNNMGYAVLERVDNTHVLIAIEPGADMIQRVKADVKAIEEQLANGGGKGDDGATFTPSVSDEGVISWTNNKNLQNPAPVNIKGVGISEIEKVSTSGLVDTYTITLTNGNKHTFTVTNGNDGVGISKIEKTATSGLVDTYTITLTNGNTSTFTVTNGQGGGGSGTVTIDEIDPSKVVFNETVYTGYSVGNIGLTNGRGILAKVGDNLLQVMKNIYNKTNYPTKKDPSVTITFPQAGLYEVGVVVAPSYSATFNKGSYNDDTNTGVKVESWSITDTDGHTSTSPSGDFEDYSFTVTESTNYKITAKATHSAGDMPKDSNGDDYPDGQIKAGTVSKTSSALTGYRKTFYGVLSEKEELTDANIRGICENLTASSTALGNGSNFTITIPESTTAKPIYRVLIAYPATLRDLTRVEDKNDANTDIKSGFKLVKKPDKSMLNIAGANDYLPIAYKVWIMDYSDPYDTANEYKVTI